MHSSASSKARRGSKGSVSLSLPSCPTDIVMPPSTEKFPVSLANAKRFSLDIRDVSDTRAVLGSISLPTRDVVVDIHLYDPSSDPDDITQFLPRDLRYLPPLWSFDSLILNNMGARPPLQPPIVAIKCMWKKEFDDGAGKAAVANIFICGDHAKVVAPALVDKLLMEAAKGHEWRGMVSYCDVTAEDVVAVDYWAPLKRVPRLQMVVVQNGEWGALEDMARRLRPHRIVIPSLYISDVEVTADELANIYDGDVPWETLFISSDTLGQSWMERHLRRGPDADSMTLSTCPGYHINSANSPPPLYAVTRTPCELSNRDAPQTPPNESDSRTPP